MIREEMIKKLKSFCVNQEHCNVDGEPVCPLCHYEWNCDFHALSDSELTKAYNDVFGRKIMISTDATNGDVIKALFPDSIRAIHQSGGLTSVLFQPGVILEDRRSEWWNAPYKAESEDE